MDDEGEAKPPADPARSLVAPLAQLGLATVQDIAAVVRSSGTAGRDLWRLINVIDRVRRVDWAGDAEPAPLAIEAAASRTAEVEVVVEAELPTSSGAVKSAAATVGQGMFGPFVRVADAALKPTTMLGAAVAPVRRAVADTIGMTISDSSADSVENLRDVGDRLIQRSLEPDAVYARRHPAFARILKELTPDEARILRFLVVAGPQPAIDIRTKTPFQIGSQRIAAGVNMIANMAGCRWPEHSPNYLVNLNRLGLVVFSKEPVEDYRRYSLLEVQPDAIDAIEHAGRSTISIYRSVYLSAFGRQFCDVCIDTEGYDAGGWAFNERGDKIVGFGRKKRTS